MIIYQKGTTVDIRNNSKHTNNITLSDINRIEKSRVLKDTTFDLKIRKMHPVERTTIGETFLENIFSLTFL